MTQEAGGRGDHERLEEVRTAAEDVLAFAAGLDEAGFSALPETDRRTFRALKSALSEIAEAVGDLPPDLFARHPDVDWRGWAGLRDMVSHRHFGPELPLLRSTVVDELPVLVAAVASELAQKADGGDKRGPAANLDG